MQIKRTIKSFVIRQSRMTHKQRQGILEYGADYLIPINPEDILDFNAIFSANKSLALDIGFGMGDSLFQLAKNYPDWNFLGVEVHQPGVGNLINLAHEANINNLKIIMSDVVQVLKTNLPDNQIDTISILFPDPWPKLRHHKRRLINADFVALLANKLKVGGVVFIKTDWAHYAQGILVAFGNFPQFELIADDKLVPVIFKDLCVTKYEAKALREGRKIATLAYRLGG